jgi:acyl-lipid omega-6 desaturase (Delta-12 desaturase)
MLNSLLDGKSHDPAALLSDAAAWRDLLPRSIARYRTHSSAAGCFQLALTTFLFAACYGSGILALRVSYPLALLFALLTSCFMVRLFMIQHDCGHGSFFASKTANDAVGFVLGVVTLTPYRCWRKYHALHHAHSGNLSKRGIGDIRTLTVREYLQLSPLRRAVYRAYRNPVVLFVVGPFFFFLCRQRLTKYIPPEWKAERRSVHQTNACIAAILALIFALDGWRAVVSFHVPVMVVASSVGTWLFYVQHQFHGTYWKSDLEWNRVAAARSGASHYDLPGILRWITANIGLHHVHHIDSRVPSYRLRECYEDHLTLHESKRLGLWESLSCVRLKLWHEEQGCMVSFDAVEADRA